MTVVIVLVSVVVALGLALQVFDRIWGRRVVERRSISTRDVPNTAPSLPQKIDTKGEAPPANQSPTAAEQQPEAA